MNHGSATVLECLPVVFWLAVIICACVLLSSRLLGRKISLRLVVRTVLRLALVEPLQKSYQGLRWLTVRLFSADPNYRFQQLYLERYPVTPLELYATIETVFAERQIIGVEVSRVTRLEWHLLSARRIYLLIRFRDAICYISSIPLGTGLSVTWRYATWPGRCLCVLFQLPGIGVITERLISPPTFYRMDIYVAFEQAIRSCVWRLLICLRRVM